MPFLILVLNIIYLSAWAFQLTTNSHGLKTTWNYNNIPLTIHSHSAFPNSYSLINSSLTQWNLVGQIQIYPSTSGVNSIQFMNNDSYFGNSVIGITELGYDKSGNISFGKIYLNANRISENRSTFSAYLPDVVTHELGHFLGLNHSEVTSSSMFYHTFAGQNTISEDDRSGLRSSYSNQFGSIRGFVKGGNHIGVLGVHVQAISRRTGEMIGSISNEDGSFNISGLSLNDSYYLYTSPLKKLSSLPRYYSNVQTNFCPASYIGGFYSECSKHNDGLPQGITLTSGQKNVDVGVVTINCDLKVQENYLLEKLKTEADPVVIYDYGLEQQYEKSFVGYFDEQIVSQMEKKDRFTIDLTHLPVPHNMKLKFKIISQAIGSPLEMSAHVRQNDFLIANIFKNRPYMELSEFWNFDLNHTIHLSSNPAQNIFEIEIRAKKVQDQWIFSSFPADKSFLQKTSLPYLIMLSLEENDELLLDTKLNYSDNKSCLDAPFTYAVEKTSAFSEEISVAATKNEGELGVLNCGSTGGTPPSSGGPFSGIIALGFMLALFMGQMLKTSKNTLS